MPQGLLQRLKGRLSTFLASTSGSALGIGLPRQLSCHGFCGLKFKKVKKKKKLRNCGLLRLKFKVMGKTQGVDALQAAVSWASALWPALQRALRVMKADVPCPQALTDTKTAVR